MAINPGTLSQWSRTGPGERLSFDCSNPLKSDRLGQAELGCEATAEEVKSTIMNPNGTISEILQHKGARVWSISPDATVYEAIEMMAEKNIGAVLVVEVGKPVGIISERDYTRKVVLKGKSSKQTAVREIITGQLIHVTSAHTIEECMRLMTTHRIRHLPVLEGEQVLGIISIGDLVNWTISAQSQTIHQLQTYITGYPE
jgi:CBS domain-containing protein